jgi:hypothetical protein
LIALDSQLEHVRHNLSYYFSPNTHLLGEALALYVAGLALPELKHAGTWAETGRRVLVEQIEGQVHPDGGHAELSTHYQRYTLDFYLLALAVARLSGDEAASVRFEEVTGRLARYARALADDRGHLPLIGDDDGGQLFPIGRRDPADASPSLAWAAALLQDASLAIDPAAPPEETFWLLGADPRTDQRPAPAAERVLLRVFPDSGYAVARTSRGDHLVLDGGRHGYLNGGHAHADALACVLTLGRRPLLIDPGTSTYTMDAQRRNRLRETAAHNTATVDGRSQALPSGPFHWQTRVDATLGAFEQLPHAAWISAQHDGYAPLVHRRLVFITDDGLIVFIDTFSGDEGPHQLDLHWTLDRSWDYQPARRGARLIHNSDAEARVVSTVELRGVRGDAHGAGWCAPVYGQWVPTWTLIATTHVPTPTEIVTAFCDASVPPGLSVTRTAASHLAVRVDRATRVDELDVDGARLTHSWRVASTVHGQVN